MSSGNTVAAVVRRTQTGTDAYNIPVYGETFTVINPALYWPGGSSESLNQQDQVQWHDTLCLPAGTDVAAIDAVIPQVTVAADGAPVLDSDGNPQGDRYEITGQPAVWPANPFSGERADFPIVLQLTRVTG